MGEYIHATAAKVVSRASWPLEMIVRIEAMFAGNGLKLDSSLNLMR